MTGSNSAHDSSTSTGPSGEVGSEAIQPPPNASVRTSTVHVRPAPSTRIAGPGRVLHSAAIEGSIAGLRIEAKPPLFSSDKTPVNTSASSEDASSPDDTPPITVSLTTLQPCTSPAAATTVVGVTVVGVSVEGVAVEGVAVEGVTVEGVTVVGDTRVVVTGIVDAMVVAVTAAGTSESRSVPQAVTAMLAETPTRTLPIITRTRTAESSHRTDWRALPCRRSQFTTDQGYGAPVESWGSSTRGSRRRVTSHPFLALATVAALVAAGCSNQDGTTDTTAPPGDTAPATAPPADTTPSDTTPGDTTPADTTPADTAPPATDPPGATFGDLASPCGPGDATIADGQNGGDMLKLATPTDKGAEVAPGLNAEMYDAAIAFADWCNEQGGIAGLQIEVLDADARLFEVPAAMERICADAFAMVGGGWAFDDQQFPRFHECGMIDIAGYTVTTAKAGSNGMVAPIPNPSNLKPGAMFAWAKTAYPDAIQHYATVYAEALTTQIVEQQYREEMEQIGGFTIVDTIPYSPLGEANWAPIAQRLKDSGVQAMSFVGVPETLAQLLLAMDGIGYRPDLILQDGGFYAPVLITRAGDAAEGVVVRSIYTPFEEADQSPAVADYLDMMATYNPEGKQGGLGLQATSAYLLFGTAAQACLADNGNVLERECVLSHAQAITEWTGGGLHTPTNPGENLPSSCAVLMQVTDGAFARLYPERDSPEDAGGGFACDDSTLIQLNGDYGDPNAGVDPDR